MANKNENTVSLWGRLGVQIDMTPEEFEILKENDEKAKDLLVKLIKSDRCFLDGESYFPEGYPNEGYVENDYDFEFNIDHQPLQKEQPFKDALDVFIEAEVPFRLDEILGVDAPEEVVQELIGEVKANTDVMFDYDRFDGFLEEKYEELQGLDQEAIKALQGEISFLRDEIDGLTMLNDSEDLISQKEKRLAILECQLSAAKVGVKLYLTMNDIIDAEHLDCFWYGGQIGAFKYKDYTVSIEVHGDVRLTVLDEECREELLVYGNRNNTGAYKAHDSDEVLAVIKDDETFHKLIDDGRIVFSNNNWVEYLIFDPNGKNITDFGWDTVLDNNVLDAFDDPTWVKTEIDEIIKIEANKDLQKSVASVQKYDFAPELLDVISDHRERLDLGGAEVEAVRQRPDLIEKICENVQEYLNDEEISFENADFSNRGFWQEVEVGEEILDIVDKAISDYKALNGLYVKQSSIEDQIAKAEGQKTPSGESRLAEKGDIDKGR